MLIRFSKLITLSICMVVVGCAATGPADDGWESSEGFKEGSGLFSNKEGAYTFSVGKGDEPASANQADPKRAMQSGAAPAQTLNQHTEPKQSSQEYEAFLEWREAKDTNSDEYQRFRKWQEFEDFQRWKQSQ